jgi:hypothetical protein
MRVALLIAVGACGPTPQTSSSPAKPVEVATAPPAPPPAPVSRGCPDAKIQIAEDMVGTVRWCTALRHREGERWFFDGALFQLVLDGTNRPLFRHEDERASENDQFRTVDLDGDGNDEVMMVSTGALILLQVVSFRDASQPMASYLRLGGEARGQPRCHATYKLVDAENGAKAIEVTGDCTVGQTGTVTLTYRWKAERLERQR